MAASMLFQRINLLPYIHACRAGIRIDQTAQRLDAREHNLSIRSVIPPKLRRAIHLVQYHLN